MGAKARYVLFQMPEFLRCSIIRGHIFYIEQATELLLEQFAALEKDENAHAFIEKYVQANSYRFDPDFHDSSEFYEEAFEQLLALHDLGGQVRLSVVAGMYHEWEKQLRKWLVAEVRHWHTGENVPQAIWKANFEQIMDMLEGLGWNIKTQDYYNKLNECRLVVNVYKHGAGASFDSLRAHFPEYFPISNTHSYSLNYTDSTSLTMNIKQLEAFSNAIVSFWENIPENIYDDDGAKVPSWLKKAFERDGQ